MLTDMGAVGNTSRIAEHARRLERENDGMRTSLESIAGNSCCEKCQEAAIVARNAMNAAPQVGAGQRLPVPQHEDATQRPGPAVAAPSETPRTAAVTANMIFPWDYGTELLVRHAEQLEREQRYAAEHECKNSAEEI